LKSYGRIAKAEGHPAVCKSSIWADEGYFLLILGVNWNLEEPAIPIKIAKIRMFSESLQDLVDEREREMVFAGGFVELTVVDTHSLSSDYPC
jgi:hypothetical protein